MGSSEFLAIGNTGHFGPSGEKVFSGFDVVYEDTKIHCTLLRCKKVEREINTFRVWENT
jgi:hypothetical protein